MKGSSGLGRRREALELLAARLRAEQADDPFIVTRRQPACPAVEGRLDGL